MNHKELTTLIRKALATLDEHDIRTARRLFEEAARHGATPLVLSCFGYCLAREEQDMGTAFALCREAIRQEPMNPLHHLNLGRVYRLAGEKALAIQAYHRGLRFGRHSGILEELRQMGIRRPLAFASLGRQHPLNKFCGFLLSRLGLRGLFLHPPE